MLKLFNYSLSYAHATDIQNALIQACCTILHVIPGSLPNELYYFPAASLRMENIFSYSGNEHDICDLPSETELLRRMIPAVYGLRHLL
jgi:hypothetical protein